MDAHNSIIYPGQPMLIALLIMQEFPSARAAMTRTEFGWAMASGSSRIPGAGDMVAAATDVLRHFQAGQNGEQTLEEAKRLWGVCTGFGSGPNHPKAHTKGLVAAKPFEAEFLQQLEHWDWSQPEQPTQGGIQRLTTYLMSRYGNGIQVGTSEPNCYSVNASSRLVECMKRWLTTWEGQPVVIRNNQ